MADESVINRMQHRYWITKQTVFKKLGKKEDEFIVSSDAELDAKLELFKSVQESSRNLLRIINQYENNLNILALEESEMGHFMKSAGKTDKTRAGKMMITVGTAILYGGQQRFTLQRPLERIYQKLETFHRRAVADTLQIIQYMERARTEYRASLNWMKDISQELDPDTYKQLERFKKVQEHVKKSKSRFDRSKHICVTKIDVLVASRNNMFSILLQLYEKSLLEFTQKCCSTYTVIANSFKGYQHYDFCVVKELSDLKPDSSIIAKEQNSGESLLEFDDNKQEEKINEDTSSTPLSQQTQDLLSLDAPNPGDDLIRDLLLDDTQSQSSIANVPVTTSSSNVFLPSYLLSLHHPSELFTHTDSKTIPALNNLTNKTASKPSSWYDLFAELDPLADPDSLSKTTGEQQKKC